MTVVHVQPEELIAALALVLHRGGAAQDIANEVAAALVEADRSGHGTHGTRQIDFYVERLLRGEVDGQARPEVVMDTGTLLRLDGRRAFGQVAGETAARLGTERALETGVCIVCLACSGHLGRNGRWAEVAAARGVGSLHFGQGRPGPGPVAPFGGREGRMNTSPFAMGLPGTGTDDFLILDAAASAVSGSTIKQLFDRGELLEASFLVRPDGTSSSDPADFVKGEAAVLPFGAFKGYAIAVFSEVLSSIVAPAAARKPSTNSLFSIYFDISQFLSPEDYRAALVDWKERITSCPPVSPNSPVLLPGDRARRHRAGALVLTADAAIHVQRASILLGVWDDVLAICPALAIAYGSDSINASDPDKRAEK